MDRSIITWLLTLIAVHIVNGQVIIKTEPNILVDGESGRVICSSDNNHYSIGLSRSGVTITNCLVSIPSFNCVVKGPEPGTNNIDYSQFYTLYSKTTTSVAINIDTVSKQRDGGHWRCTVQNPNNNINTTIDVKVPVKDVEIENKNSLNLVNGVSTTMNCKVTNNPDPVVNFRWFIVETDQTLSTSSSFQLTPKQNQNGQTLSCSAENEYGSMKSDTIIINVQYQPSVKLEPEVFGNYKIIDIVELKCNVTDANPNNPSRFRYEWYNDTITTLTGQVGSTVLISQNGIYTCSVSNGIGTPGLSDNSITVEVLFQPRVTVTPNYSIIESNTLTIPCIATSNPVPSYTWSGPNNFLQSHQNLNISSINRNQTGRYTCTVTNIMIPTTGGQQTGTGTGDTDVIVLYGPEVHVSTNMIDILESEKLVVDCSVIQSKPDDASINWYKPDGTRISSNVLSIDNIRREEDGIFSCNSSKVLTPSIGTKKTNVDSKTTRVNVLYLDPVKITRDKLGNIQEGDKINITCTTQSNPTASITYRNGTDVIQTDFSNQASFIKLSAICLDTGVYSCQVNNTDIPQTSYNDTIQILVNCSPREDPHINHQYKITGNVGENVELTAQVISYPRPIFQWYYRENNVDIPIINNGSFQQTDRSININTFLSKLTINITSNKFYRRYYVNVSNEVNPGGYDLQYDIIAENVPDRPNNVTYINETSETICIEWTPGFNGGASQSFIVQHSAYNITWVNSSTIPDRTNNGRVDYCIEGLEPDTSYYIRVIARNEYGESLIGTLSLSEPHKTASRKDDNGGGIADNVALIGGVVGATLALMIIAIVVCCFCYRKKKKSQGKSTESGSQLVLNEVPKSPSPQMIIDENPAYISSDDILADNAIDNETKTAGPTYAAVKKTNKSKAGNEATPVYSSVNKTQQKESNKKDGKKRVDDKKKKTKRTDIKSESQNVKTKKPGEVYENVGIFGNINPIQENVYENNSGETPDKQANKKENDDLVYVDLKFEKKPSNKVIKKQTDEDKVEYGSIDYGKRGPTPPPSSDSSDNEMDYLPPKKD